MKSSFKGKHLVIIKEKFMDRYFNKEVIDRWETFHEQDLPNKFSLGESININDEELSILKVINNLDGSVIYKVDKILSKKNYS